MVEACRALELMQSEAEKRIQLLDNKLETFDLDKFCETHKILEFAPHVVLLRLDLESLHNQVQGLDGDSEVIRIVQMAWNIHFSGFTSLDMFENWVMTMQKKPSQSSRVRMLHDIVKSITQVMTLVQLRTPQVHSSDEQDDPNTLLAELNALGTNSPHNPRTPSKPLTHRRQVMEWSEYQQGLTVNS
eukprot:c20763_g3_i1.p1 GENE.c20763_g3_i1~~c20763_g3_i1.p1  ORF type:complete len:187 (+),score=49.42 c20763_g3_i1:327-887(+)